MDFISELENNSILLIPNNIKDKVLNYINDNNILKSIKIISFNDLKNGLYYTYNNEAINYVMKNYNANYMLSKSFIDDTYYIDSLCDNNKINNIYSIKENLDNNNLLIKDKLFIELLKSKRNLYVYGFTNINKFNEHMLTIASKYINVIKLDSKENDYKHEVFEFNNIDEEILFVRDSIISLISSGINTNKIYLSNYSDEYYFTIKRIFESAGMHVYLNDNITLYETAIGIYFLNNITYDKEELLSMIRTKFNVNSNSYNSNVYNTLFSLLNTYYWAEHLTDVKELITEEMRHKTINSPHYTNEINVTNIIDNVFKEDEYVFLIGFNLGSIPILKKDEDYINDSIKTSLYENTSEYNKNIKNSYMNVIKNTKNIIITYKLSSNFENYLPSFLIDNNYLTITHKNYDVSLYDDNINILALGKKIDDLIKFNITDEKLEILNNTYKIPYKEYDNKFTEIDNNLLINSINDKINFSYSSITKYYQCPFSYYISYILKLDTYEQTTDAFIGSLFHEVLNECLTDETKNIDDVYDSYVSNARIVLTNKDKFFIKILKKEIHFIIETIKEQYKHSNHQREEHEKNIEIEVKRNIKTKLKGFVDKILYYNNSAIIIDYKTGNESIDEDLFKYGLKIQLPIYLYLLKLYDENIEIVGLYIQRLMDLNIPYDSSKDYISEKRKRLKLNGITFNDISSIKEFDDSYESSDVIHGLGLKQDGTWKSVSNVLNIPKREEIKCDMESLINSSIDSVSNGEFNIHPLKIPEKKIDACKYCEYKDLCFRSFKDYNNIILERGEEDE